MLEVLKGLMSKVSGMSSIVVTGMILIFLLGTAEKVNSMNLCLGLITGLTVLSMVLQLFKKEEKEEKEEKGS